MKRTVLITGATGELGKNLARALSQTGYAVIINYRKNKVAAERLAADIKARAVLQADVTNPVEVTELFKKTGKIDVLINNVGDFIWKPLAKTSNEEFSNVLQNNLLSAWYCTKAALPKMRAQKFGRILNFGSAGCGQITTRPMTTPYYIAKTGLLMLTKSLAKEEQKNGITVNMVSPGILPSSFVKPDGAPVVSFDDITRAVLFLVADTNQAVSGANIEVTGGWRPE